MTKNPLVNKEASAAPKHRTQYISTFCASLGGFCIGTVLGFASPATYQLREVVNASVVLNGSSYLEHGTGEIFDDTFTLTDEQIGWFSSAFSIGALVGGLISGPLMNLLGRRGTMIATIVPSTIGWLLIGFGSNFSMLVWGRIVTGLLAGIQSSVVNNYIAEIASSDIRGSLGTAFNVMFSSGIVYSFLIGSMTSWYTLALICCIPSTLFSLLMVFNKETPSHLLSKGRDEEARAALQYFRGPDYDVSMELAAIKGSQGNTSANKISMATLKQPHIYKPILIVFFLMSHMQLCGINALIFNLATIFESSNSGMSAYTSSVLCAVFQAIVPFATAFLIETAGRKILLIISCAVMAVSQGCVGLYFYLLQYSEEWTMQYLSWLLVLAVSTFMIGFSLGIGPVPYVFLGEMFPPSVRETASGVAVAINWTMSFLVIYSFAPLQLVLHDYGTYWLYAVMNVAGALFCVMVVKETKGKTLEEISAMFGGPEVKTEKENQKFDHVESP